MWGTMPQGIHGLERFVTESSTTVLSPACAAPLVSQSKIRGLNSSFLALLTRIHHYGNQNCVNFFRPLSKLIHNLPTNQCH